MPSRAISNVARYAKALALIRYFRAIEGLKSCQDGMENRPPFRTVEPNEGEGRCGPLKVEDASLDGNRDRMSTVVGAEFHQDISYMSLYCVLSDE
jgi:hypothetical protein